MGEPLRMAELIAELDGPIYVERVALFNNKQRFRARKAIKKAIQLQVEGKGLGFVEVLSECPTHLRMTPEEAEKWVEESMVPVFPLGVKKDLTVEAWFDPGVPVFDAERIVDAVGATTEAVERFATQFPKHLDPADVALKFAGAGGDGAQTIAKLTCQTAINEGFDSTYIPSYGPESRGGTSYADVHVAAEEVLSPAVAEPHALIAFNAPSLDKFGPTVRRGGTVVYDETVVSNPPDVDQSINMIGVPMTKIAHDLGKLKVKNVVALGALQAATDFMPAESLMTAMRNMLHADCALIELNEAAFQAGCEAVME
jgi:2-oxoisovalerate ferredoxin oxidoreductase beta subunit